jgi:hypothetical protein
MKDEETKSAFASGQAPDFESTREAAMMYFQKPWGIPVPAYYRSKKPTHENWGRIEITAEKLLELFATEPLNIGLQLGPRAGGLVDVDLDSPWTRKLAHEYLPETGLKEAAIHRLLLASSILSKIRIKNNAMAYRAAVEELLYKAGLKK